MPKIQGVPPGPRLRCEISFHPSGLTRILLLDPVKDHYTAEWWCASPEAVHNVLEILRQANTGEEVP